MQWNIILALLSEIGVVLSTLHIKQCTMHMWRRRGSHCGSSISCLNGGRSCACIWMYNNVPNHWFFYLVWVYTFELGLFLFARLCSQNHTSKLYAQSHTPTAKPYAQSQTIHPQPNHTPNTMCPKLYAQKPYTQCQTIRPKPYTQNHTPKTIR